MRPTALILSIILFSSCLLGKLIHVLNRRPAHGCVGGRVPCAGAAPCCRCATSTHNHHKACTSLSAGGAYATANAPLSEPHNSPQTQHPPSSTSTTSSRSSSRALLEAQLVPPAACGKLPSEPLSQAITSCLCWQQQVGCAFLEAQGYIPVGVQSLTSHSLSGNLTAPDTCGSSTVSLVSKQQQQQVVFDAGGRAVLAVVAKGSSSTAYFFGRGAHKVGTVQSAVLVS
jgi:hypothetical protein